MSENITQNSLSGEEGVTSTDGIGAVTEQDTVDQAVSSAEVANIKDVLGQVLGKEFKDDETALKAVKDTFSYVGKSGQEISDLKAKIASLQSSGNPDVMNQISEVKQRLADAEFYNENPEYKPYRNLISKFGTNPAEVVKNEEFQGLYSKVKSADESAKAKSVLQSNPRLGQVKDSFANAEKLRAGGNEDAARNEVVNSVLEAYELK